MVKGRVITGFSRSGHVAKELPPALSHYFDIANFRSIFMKVSQKAKSPEPFGPGLRNGQFYLVYKVGKRGV